MSCNDISTEDNVICILLNRRKTLDVVVYSNFCLLLHNRDLKLGGLRSDRLYDGSLSNRRGLKPSGFRTGDFRNLFQCVFMHKCDRASNIRQLNSNFVEHAHVGKETVFISPSRKGVDFKSISCKVNNI